jgi:hypothetical protein
VRSPHIEFDALSTIGIWLAGKVLAVRTKFILALAIVMAFELANSDMAMPQAPVELVTRRQSIPKDFKTYTLFLVCNPQWLDPTKNSGLYDLYVQFQAFGRAIGDDNAAVWFWKSDGYERSDASLAKILDVERSVRFCQAWKLKPSEGPHLVITATYPDESHLAAGLSQDHAVYALANMSPPDISSLLAKLTDQLVVNGKVAASSNEVPPGAANRTPHVSLWVQLLAATQQTLNTFGCAWSFKVSAGPVSADLKSCKTT